MNIQIFGLRKSFDTKKAERWFKERRIKYQYLDLESKGLSAGEYRSVKAAVGYDALVKEVDERATIHDFRMVIGPTHTNLIFDAVVPFGGEKSNHELEEEIKARVRQMEGTYFAVVRVENSYL